LGRCGAGFSVRVPYASRFHGALRPSSPRPPCQGRSGSRAETVPLHGVLRVRHGQTRLAPRGDQAAQEEARGLQVAPPRRHVGVQVRCVHARGDLAPPTIPSNGAQVAATGRREHGEARQGQLLCVEDLDGAAVQEGSRRREARGVVPVAGERQGRGTYMRGAWRFPRSKLLVGDLFLTSRAGIAEGRSSLRELRRAGGSRLSCLAG
jgi:hypothetical protein